ncbi:unnamed protein product [Dovyalis caffra]|uniref:Uncharacterized protein n=1 Tax=Dovyalis caffra TaxID=77055 RepID=A0AAV1R988_9ROSI|nr:unnamed protein product [Dovyalis caffra]
MIRLRASEGACTSSSVGDKLSGLQDLHDRVNNLLILPLTQQAIAQENNEKWVDELLDGSLLVLDLCNTAKDALLQTKECVHELQSILRGCGEIGLTSEVKKYLTSRKVLKKAICKALKGMQNKCTFSTYNGDHETTTVFCRLKKVEAISFDVFESLLTFVYGPKTRPTALLSLVDHNTYKSDNIKGVQSQLEKLESCIQDIEEGLECLFRNLIKTRVFLLNILSR